MSRLLVCQVGGAGDIAGGLSQVVQSLCAWSFEHVDTAPYRTRRLGSRTGTVAALLSTTVGLAHRLPARRRTVIAVHLSQGGSFLREGVLAMAAHAAGFTVVAHLHGSSFPTFARRHPRLVRSVLRQTEAVLALTDETAAAVSSAVPDATVVSIPNAVPVPAKRDKDDLVVFAGTVCHRKGVDVLLDAWSQLTPGHGMTLSIVGPVAMDLTPWDVTADVTICGDTAHDDVLEMMRRARMVVLPSRAEAMPLVLLEAMAAGCAAVSTDVGTIAELLRDGAGVVIAPGNTAELAAAMNSVLHDRERLDALGSAARTRILSTYSTDAVFPRVESVWRAAADRRQQTTAGVK
ncbi:MAG: glycosyltransferase family 4 protein [Rhodococcus sp. (in: high G+C Gram-positive bacteria)]